MDKQLAFKMDRIANEALNFLDVWREWGATLPHDDDAADMNTKITAAAEKLRLVVQHAADSKAREDR